MKYLKKLVFFGLLFTVAQIQAAPWVACGNLSQMTVGNKATIPGFPLNKYEYGMIYNGFNGNEPVPVLATTWNVGYRIYNKTPYMTFADNPSVSMNQGGFVFYSGTTAPDDNCGVGGWRHRYWWTDSTNVVRTGASNGCYGVAQPVFCRLR